MYNTYSQVKLKTSMLRWSLCDYRDAQIPVSGTITITWAGADDAAKQLYEGNQGAMLEIVCHSLTAYMK